MGYSLSDRTKDFFEKNKKIPKQVVFSAFSRRQRSKSRRKESLSQGSLSKKWSAPILKSSK
jgi:hypothetical protein